MYELENSQIKNYIEEHLRDVRERYLNKDVVIPCGKYEGRKGRVTHVTYDFSHGICMQMQPYAQRRAGPMTITTNELLWDHVDARTYWPMSYFDKLNIWEIDYDGIYTDSVNAANR